MTKKPEKEDSKEKAEEQRRQCSIPNCTRCDAERRHELAKINAELIIQEAEQHDMC
jgi:hypothetical protein